MQFTTYACRWYYSIKLLSIKQRYKLNAIHNITPMIIGKEYTVVNKAKIQIECNSQL